MIHRTTCGFPLSSCCVKAVIFWISPFDLRDCISFLLTIFFPLCVSIGPFLLNSCHFYNLQRNKTRWASARRRSESPESTVPDTAPPSESSCARSRSASTPPTVVPSAERTPSSALALVSGTASPAARSLPVVPTLSPQLPPSPSAVPSVVCERLLRSRHKNVAEF